MANLSAFYDTRDCFKKNICYNNPLSYDEWAQVPDDQKVVFLFVQFFDEITLAWTKANAFDFIAPEEGVETVIQYLQKQVCDRYIKGHPKRKVSNSYFNSHRTECEEHRIIEENPKRFSPGYIYRIAYNCLYCICHDLKSVQDRWVNEVDPIVVLGEDELNLIDYNPSSRVASAEVIYEAESFENEFWDIIEDMGVDAEKVMRYLLSGDEKDLKKLSKRNSDYATDPLRDVEVSLEAAREIINQLKERFLSLSVDSKCGNYILQANLV